MPIAIAFAEPDTLILTAAGAVTFAEVAVTLDELLDDPRISEGTRVLCDCRQVTDTPSTPELRLIARDLAPLRERGVTRMAVCAESTFVYGVARMFAVFADMIGISVGAFRRMEDAERWLASFQEAA
jgi:hypothetical protein